MVQKIIAWVVVIVWMVFILSLSSATADVSKEQSGFVKDRIRPVLEMLNLDHIEDETLSFYVRKSAHGFIYFVLGVLLIIALNHKYLIAFAIGTGFACIDEYYQTFVPGRSGEVRDVLIDSAGVLVGVLLVRVIKKKYKRRERPISIRR